MKRARVRGLAALGLAALGLLAACSHTKARKPAELQDIANPALKLRTLWSRSPGGGDEGIFTELSLTLKRDGLYGADADGRVFALKPADGELLWKTKTKARVASGPVVAGGHVLVGTLDGEVIALKRADGAPLWRSAVSSEVLAAPSSDGERVVARCVDGRIFGLAAADGSRLWSFDRTVPNLTLRGLSAPLISGLRVITGLDNGHVVSLKLSDGQLLWDQPVSLPTGRTELERLTDVDANLLEGEDAVYALSFGGEVAALDPASGQVLWRRSIKSYTGAALLGNLLFVTDADSVIWALDARTGAAAWSQKELLYRRLSAPVALGDHIVVGDYEGYLHWIEPADGKIVARTRVGSAAIKSAPVAGDGVVYAANTDGKIAAVAAQAGK